MRSITSVEFRKTYQRLTEPVEVTALGRVIGMWNPVFQHVIRFEQVASDEEVQRVGALAQAALDRITGPAYSSRPFTPVPKKGK